MGVDVAALHVDLAAQPHLVARVRKVVADGDGGVGLGPGKSQGRQVRADHNERGESPGWAELVIAGRGERVSKHSRPKQHPGLVANELQPETLGVQPNAPLAETVLE